MARGGGGVGWQDEGTMRSDQRGPMAPGMHMGAAGRRAARPTATDDGVAGADVPAVDKGGGVDTKNLKGLSVISIDDGAKIGVVEKTYLNPVKRQIVGFIVGNGGLFGGTAGVLDASDVHSIGPDAITVNSRSAVRADAALVGQDAHLIDFDQLNSLNVMTEGGTAVGQVAGSEFDPSTLKLTAIEASPGFFKSNKTIPIDEVVSIGTDVVIVSNRVCQTDQTDQTDQSAQTQSQAVGGQTRAQQAATATGHGGTSPA